MEASEHLSKVDRRTRVARLGSCRAPGLRLLWFFAGSESDLAVSVARAR